MFKLFVFFVFLSSLLYAGDKVEIYAGNMESEGNLVRAYDNVTMVYKDYFLSANNALYNRQTGDLELFGNVRAAQGKDYKFLGKYAKLNIINKDKAFKPFFMLEKTSGVWLSGEDGFAKDKDIDINSGMMSGCNPNNPLWKIEFTSSRYDTDSKWMNLYNARVYIYDIPVVYTPYFGYSLDTTRRTGLLTPAIGISDKEGFFYEQPLYIAEQNWWDLELKPQVRTNRGYGGYSTFRFVDSAISKGEVTTGYFKEKDSYFLDENLANSSHYGLNFKYANSDFMNQWLSADLQGQSGVYLNTNHMNDVDYINLSTNDTTQNATATQVLSRANVFYNTDDYYMGAYFKYYQDLTKQSNENTLQKLPTLHYHSYLDTLLQNHLLYSFDIQSTNIQRDINKKVVQTNMNIPVSLQTSLFDEYLNLSYTNYLYAQHSNFRGNEITPIAGVDYNNGYFANNYNILSASTQLTRAYENLTHVVGFGLTYTTGGSEAENGYYMDNKDFCSKPENENSSQCEFYNIVKIDEATAVDFSQYLFDTSGKQIVYHRVAQAISNESKQSQVGELENELDYQITSTIDYYNNMFFNYDANSFSKVFNQVSYTGGGFNLAFAHLYKNTYLLASENYSPYTSYITSSARYTYNEHYSYHMRYDYDLETSLKKSTEVGFLYKKRCWDFGLRYVENNRPILTKNSAESVLDRYVYINIVLRPLMTSGGGASDFATRLPDTLKGS
jgi:LPS-assembly protein